MARHVSYSELRDGRQCLLKHHLSWVEGWTPQIEAAPLSKGRLFHDVMQAHYNALAVYGDYQTAAERVLYACEDDEIRSLVEWMYEGYLEAYGDDEDWEILAVEEAREVWLPTATGARSGFRLKVRFDLLVRDQQDRVWLVDHKTGSRFPSEIALDLQDQDSLYQWALERVWVPVYGVIYNLCRTQRNKGPMALEDRFKRIPIYRTQTQLANTAIDAWRTAKRISAAKYPERATDSERCIRMCSFTEACLHGRKGGDMEDFLSSQGFTKRNGNGHASEGDETE